MSRSSGLPDGPPGLVRRLGTGDAVVLGLGSMLGAGVFSAFAPAAAAAGTGLLLGLAVAAVVALCNATSSAQLAAQHPLSGGTYVYGREQLGPWWGFVAGWSFVLGKSASCAAMALVFAAHTAPDGLERPVAVLAVLALAGVNLAGVTRTAGVTRVLLVVVLTALGVVVAAALLGGQADAGRLASWDDPVGGGYGVLQSAGLLFFAFAGYARIATLGEEVRDPARTIPRAVVSALAVAAAVYAAVAVALLAVLEPAQLARSSAPLVDAVEAGSLDALAPVVRAGAAAGALGALLGLLAGVGRTVLAMSRGDDLPGWLGRVSPRTSVPHTAEVALALAVSGLVLTVDLRGALGFSSFGVLLYYVVANLAALTQTGGHRRYPRALQVLGAGGCAVLIITLPPASVLAGLAVLALGVAVRLLRRRDRSGPAGARAGR